MILNHEVINLNNFAMDYNDSSRTTKLILLEEGTTIQEIIVAQAISLDIRGNFGDFLNQQNLYNYIWIGNQFEIEIHEENVFITKFVLDDFVPIRISLVDWLEALHDWKVFYLKELGFKEFKSEAMNHLFGVLLLTDDKISNSRELEIEMIRISIKECAQRFGIAISTIYRDCKKIIAVNSISDFYQWVSDIFNGRQNSYTYNLLHKEYNATEVFKRYLDIAI